MTKQEERAALAKIEKIIKAAGPDSYIGMAFAGCCEIAADNIENDFGCSMKQRYETEREKRLEIEKGYNRLVDKLENAEKDYEAAHAAAHEIAAQKDKEIDLLRQQLKTAQAAQLPADLYKLVWLAVDSHIERANRRIADCVEELVYFADAPKDIAVAHALTGLREAHATKAQYTQLLEQLEAFEPKGV